MAGSEPHPSHPLVDAVLKGSAPRPVLLGAARGLLPLPRGESLRLLVHLSSAADPEISALSAAALSGFGEEEILSCLREPAASAEVLRHFATASTATARVKEAILDHPAADDAALLAILPSLPPAGVDLILLNLDRLLRSPRLLTAVESLAGLTPLQKTRVDEIRRHFLRPAPGPQPGQPPPREAPAAGTATTGGPAPGAGPAAPAAPPASEPAASDLEAPAGDEGAIESAAFENAVNKIMKMNTAEKIQLAFKGTREERSILIKDSSKMVQQAVLESPKLTENEVESIARMRSVGEEVLRRIAGTKEWMKNYTVVLSLTSNPKTPMSIAMNLVSRLNAHDLKILVTDKNVAEVIRRQARKVVDARNAGTARR